MRVGQQRPEKYCQARGARIDAKAVICPKCGVAQPNSIIPPTGAECSHPASYFRS